MLIKAACVMALLATGAVAQAPAGEGVPEKNKSDIDKIICKKDETPGTKLGAKKVCMTAQEWWDRKEAAREHTERIQASTDGRQ